MRAGEPHESGGTGKGVGVSPQAHHPCGGAGVGQSTPIPLSPQVTVDMELSVSGLEDMGDTITFQLQLRR